MIYSISLLRNTRSNAKSQKDFKKMKKVVDKAKKIWYLK